jgi:hypothetical protein
MKSILAAAAIVFVRAAVGARQVIEAIGSVSPLFSNRTELRGLNRVDARLAHEGATIGRRGFGTEVRI